jgi:hypothetical protein
MAQGGGLQLKFHSEPRTVTSANWEMAYSEPVLPELARFRFSDETECLGLWSRFACTNTRAAASLTLFGSGSWKNSIDVSHLWRWNANIC